MRKLPVSIAAVETVVTAIDQTDSTHTARRLQNRQGDLHLLVQKGFVISSTISVPNGDQTVIVDTLVRTTEPQ